MANLRPVPINKKQIRTDLNDFRALLNDPNRPELSESTDILPFFKAHPQLCAFMGTYDSYIVDFKNIVTAHEFDIFSDHVADLAIGTPTNLRARASQSLDAHGHGQPGLDPKGMERLAFLYVQTNSTTELCPTELSFCDY